MSATATMELPESQRLIAVSLGKIAASRGQKGGINLHKNLLVATVLHKARTAYMIQHYNAAKQRAAQPSPVPATTTPTTTTTENVEMRDSSASEPSSPSSSPVSASAAAAAPTFPAAAPPSAAPHGASVAPTPENGSAAESADVSSVQVSGCDDKENTPPPPSPSPLDCGAAPSSPESVHQRLHGEKNLDTVKDSKEKKATLLSSRAPMSHTQRSSTPDYVSKSPSCSSCVLKRRRAMDNENVSAPKVRIVEAPRGSSSPAGDSAPEPMQCDSPQISNLVNIFNTSFQGLSGGQSLLSTVSSHTHKLSESLTCAKEIKAGLDSLHQPLVLSV